MVSTPTLGIDLGTSHTVAVLRHIDGRIESVLFDGSPLLPSAVFADDDGQLTVGRDALDSARRDPSRFEPHPKRHVQDGTVLLGHREIPVEELFAAVLAKVQVECRQVLGADPGAVALTYPASWGPTRRLILEDAARAAGFGTAVLVPEPIAAATYYAVELGHQVPIGHAVVVHDFGGGTFDASVVERGPAGLEVLAVDGLDDLGGIDIDAAIVRHLGERVGDEDAWQRLLTPQTPGERRQWRSFHDDVRQVKERLSRQSNADVFIPVVDREVHLTRTELEGLTRPLLARAVNVVRAVIRSSRLLDDKIAGIFLVGGASRMPLVSTVLHQELDRPPTVIDRLEQVVAHGALLAAAAPPAAEPGHWPAAPDPRAEPQKYLPSPPLAVSPQPVATSLPGPVSPTEAEVATATPPSRPDEPAPAVPILPPHRPELGAPLTRFPGILWAVFAIFMLQGLLPVLMAFDDVYLEHYFTTVWAVPVAGMIALNWRNPGTAVLYALTTVGIVVYWAGQADYRAGLTITPALLGVPLLLRMRNPVALRLCVLAQLVGVIMFVLAVFAVHSSQGATPEVGELAPGFILYGLIALTAVLLLIRGDASRNWFGFRPDQIRV